MKVACHHAARYFLLNNRGAIAPGYLADFAIIDNFRNFNVEMVFKKGELYYNDGKLKDFPAPAIEEYLDERAHDTFHVRHLTKSDFEDVRQRGVIGMIPGEIVSTDNGYADHVDLQKDILKIAVVERHKTPGTSVWAIFRAMGSSPARLQRPSPTTLITSSSSARTQRIWHLRQTTSSKTTAASSS